MSQNQQVNCFKCKYFYITWNANAPRGCLFFGFKTKLIPCIVVLKSSGAKCKAFIAKSENKEP